MYWLDSYLIKQTEYILMYITVVLKFNVFNIRWIHLVTGWVHASLIISYWTPFVTASFPMNEMFKRDTSPAHSIKICLEHHSIHPLKSCLTSDIQLLERFEHLWPCVCKDKRLTFGEIRLITSSLNVGREDQYDYRVCALITEMEVLSLA